MEPMLRSRTAVVPQVARTAGAVFWPEIAATGLLGGSHWPEEQGLNSTGSIQVDDLESDEPAPGPSPSADSSGQAGKIRILLADDHQILREGLVSLLSEEPDMEVVGEASNGQEAVELARRVRPHVILMDVTMPRLDGIQATRQITAELSQTAVIGLSMHEEDDMAAAMRAAGAVAYLSKGGPSDALIEAIRQFA